MVLTEAALKFCYGGNMADKKSNVAAKVRQAIEPSVVGMGYSIWNISFGKEVTDYTLEIEIDKQGTVDIDDCIKVNDVIEPIIDELDPIEMQYNLVVSSAGLDRTLSCDEHFNYAINGGYTVTAKLYTATEGSKEHSGILQKYDADTITVNNGEKQIKIDRKAVSKLTAWCG